MAGIDELHVVAVEILEIVGVDAKPLGSDRMIARRKQLGGLRILHDRTNLVADKGSQGFVRLFAFSGGSLKAVISRALPPFAQSSS